MRAVYVLTPAAVSASHLRLGARGRRLNYRKAFVASGCACVHAGVVVCVYSVVAGVGGGGVSQGFTLRCIGGFGMWRSFNVCRGQGQDGHARRDALDSPADGNTHHQPPATARVVAVTSLPAHVSAGSCVPGTSDAFVQWRGGPSSSLQQRSGQSFETDNSAEAHLCACHLSSTGRRRLLIAIVRARARR